tara:strand:+ start:1052 stop:1321 length:270 start_codon:yes stop_codon:yes gene_type:complete
MGLEDKFKIKYYNKFHVFFKAVKDKVPHLYDFNFGSFEYWRLANSYVGAKFEEFKTGVSENNGFLNYYLRKSPKNLVGNLMDDSKLYLA